MGRARGTIEKLGLGEIGEATTTALKTAPSRTFSKDRTTILSTESDNPTKSAERKFSSGERDQERMISTLVIRNG